MLAHSLWQRRFGGSPDVLGVTLTLDGQPVTVIGVMLPELDFPIVSKPEIFAPLQIDRSNSCGRGCVTLRVIACLKEVGSLDVAHSDMSTIAARLEQEYPEENLGIGVNLVPLHEHVVGDMRAALWVLLGAVGLVLLIACANVASLMLACAADRDGREPLEALLPVLDGEHAARGTWKLDGIGPGALGRRFSFVARTAKRAALREVTVDGHAFGFTLVVAVLTGLAFGLVPAVSASKPNLHRCLKEGGRGSSGGSQRLRSAIVVFEVAMALALLVGAGLLIRSFASLMQVGPGFDTRGVLAAQLNLLGPAYDARPARTAFVDRMIARVEALPGVEGAGVIYVLPMANADADAGFLIEGRPPPRPGQTPVAWYRPVSPGYFETMKMRHARGRLFRDGDDAEAPQVVLINEAAAARYWPNEDPLLSTVRFGGASRRVVGVVFDTKHFGLDQAARPAMYLPYAQLPMRFMNLLVRTSGSPEDLAPTIRSAVRDIDPGLAVANVTTMDAVLADTVAEPRVVTTLLVVFALSALALAAIGLYGVMSYTVRQRTHEIWIRMALGANASDVLGWSVSRGMLLMAVGAVLGLASAFGLTRFMESLLFWVARTDALTFTVGPAVLAVVALLASYLPARRAARVDPVLALRHE